MVKASIRNGYMLVLFLIVSVILNEIIILGNDFIAEATDSMLSGQPVYFSEFIIPLLWMVMLGTIASYLKSIFGNHYSAMVQKEIRTSLSRHLMKLPFSYFDKKGTGSIITRLISDMEELGKFFSEILPILLVNIVTVVTATIYLIQMDVLLIIVLFISYPIMLIVADRLSKKLAELTKKLRTHMDERTEKAYDAIQGIVVGRSYNLYELHKQKIDAVIDAMVKQASKSTRISSLGWVLKNVITTIPVIFCYLFALYETMQGRITVGEMLAFAVLLNRILYPIGDIVFCANDIREIGVSLKRIQEIYNQKEERKGGMIQKLPKNTGKIPAIEWNDIDFCYSDNSHPILNKISFSIEAGEQTAFVGGSGEGKTTIFKLLCGFYEKMAVSTNYLGISLKTGI